MCYNGTDYVYLHNLQGDVTGIVTWKVPRCYNMAMMLEVPTTTEEDVETLSYDNHLGIVCVDEERDCIISGAVQSPVRRLINADSQLNDDANMLGGNVFAYYYDCINCKDANGGKQARFSRVGFTERRTLMANQCDGKYMEHIHIYNKRKSLGIWDQNLDGSPQDEENSNDGDPPNSVRDRLKERGIWDWDQKKADWEAQNKPSKKENTPQYSISPNYNLEYPLMIIPIIPQAPWLSILNIVQMLMAPPVVSAITAVKKKPKIAVSALGGGPQSRLEKM